MARKGMKPTPVAVNKAKAGWSERSDRTMSTGAVTVFDLRRYFNPKSLLLGIMKVDELGEEENDSCSPEHCDR